MSQEQNEKQAAAQYKVLCNFTDTADKTAPKGANVYWAGKSTYPRMGYNPSADRIAYLAGESNKFKKPVIAKA